MRPAGEIPFGDLRRTTLRLGDELRAAMDRVMASGWFILGEEVAAFEAAFARTCGARHAVGVGNGTDAIALALRALGVGPGDEVVTSPVTAAFTALGIVSAGATPVFADVQPDTGLLDPAAVEAVLTPLTRALVPVHLYGRPADMETLTAMAHARGLWLVEDAAQAHGATWHGRPVGSLGDVAAFSFYPSKNLGAAGDGGAVVTDDPAVAERLRRLRDGGQNGRYNHVDLGVNSRLDEIQAAVLRVRLEHLPGDQKRRAAIAAAYDTAVAASPKLSRAPDSPEAESAHHLYVVQTSDREGLRQRLAEAGVGAAVHYPTPAHRQPALARFARGPLPVAERLCERVCSVPLYPELTDDEVARVAGALARIG